MQGKPVRKSFYSYVSKSDAERQADEYVAMQRAAALAGIQVLDEDKTTFNEWAALWLKTYKRGKVKDNSFRYSYEMPTNNHLVPYFGKAYLTDIKPIHIQQFFDEKRGKYRLESLRKMRACLWSIFETAVDNDLCRRNPVSKSLTLKSEIKNMDKLSYTQEQYDKVHKFVGEHLEGLSVLILLETGISRSELLGLRWEDFDYENKILRIRQGLVEQKSTESETYVIVEDGLKNEYRQRDIPISTTLAYRINETPRIIEVGGNRKKGIPPKKVITKNIIYSPNGSPYNPHNWCKRTYNVVMQDMNEANPDLPILSPHELRHTRATLWKDAGVDLFTIARLLGHSDLDMLAKRYAHDNIETMRKALGL